MRLEESIIKVLNIQFGIPEKDIVIERSGHDLKYPDAIIIKDSWKYENLFDYLPTCIERII